MTVADYIDARLRERMMLTAGNPVEAVSRPLSLPPRRAGQYAASCIHARLAAFCCPVRRADGVYIWRVA